MSSNPPIDLTPQYLSEWDGRPVVITAITLIVLNTIFVFLRFLSRYQQTAPYGWDDVFIIPSWLLTVVISLVSIGESDQSDTYLNVIRVGIE